MPFLGHRGLCVPPHHLARCAATDELETMLSARNRAPRQREQGSSQRQKKIKRAAESYFTRMVSLGEARVRVCLGVYAVRTVEVFVITLSRYFDMLEMIPNVLNMTVT